MRKYSESRPMNTIVKRFSGLSEKKIFFNSIKKIFKEHKNSLSVVSYSKEPWVSLGLFTGKIGPIIDVHFTFTNGTGINLEIWSSSMKIINFIDEFITIEIKSYQDQEIRLISNVPKCSGASYDFKYKRRQIKIKEHLEGGFTTACNGVVSTNYPVLPANFWEEA